MRCLSLRSNKVPSSFKQACSALATAAAVDATPAAVVAAVAEAAAAALATAVAAVSAAALGTAGPRTMVVCSVLCAIAGCCGLSAAFGATCFAVGGRLCGACERTMAVLSDSDLSAILPAPLACWCFNASWLMMIEVCCDRSCLTAAGVTGAGRCAGAVVNGAVVLGCSLAAPPAAPPQHLRAHGLTALPLGHTAQPICRAALPLGLVVPPWPRGPGAGLGSAMLPENALSGSS